MPLGRNRRSHGGIEAWPGYVDALSTLLMVLIFVLLVFVLAQGFLSVALSSRDRALDRLNRQVAELGELLALERGQAEELRGSLGRTSEELRAATTARDTAQRALAGLRDERDRLAADRDTTRGERDRLAARIADLEAASRGGASRVAELEQRLAEALARTEAVGGQAARTTANLTDAQRQLAAQAAALEATRRDLDNERTQREAREAEAQTLARDLNAARQTLEAARRDIASLRAEAVRLDRTVQADRATIEARLSDIVRLNDQVRALEALRDQLERQAQQAIARAGTEEQQRVAAQAARAEADRARAAAEALVAQAQARATESDRARAAAEAQSGEFGRLSESARAQVALLTRQLESVRAEIARLNAALDSSESQGREREAQIALLGQRLNAALAARVEELQSYRSDFFGRLRRVLGDRADVRIVGDRFVFQSEVLFPVGSADLSPAGAQQIREIGRVLIELSSQFPADLNWVLRVDGHADRTPIRGRFASNWELSAARAISVAQLLIAEGLPPNRVAAAAFGDTQPLDDRDTPDAYARNRRIELRLTDR
ncbi:peptidoglycan -binding protein [Falsiroseomonas sp. HW251]|uniref:peptidoglycan -binding protein n=1 Tax=Falsiroseomonas sp. HW251 TaxID=3390998 RepID=UPI003D31CC53